MPDDVDDPVALAEAEAEIHASARAEVHDAPAGRRRWLAWVIALLLIVVLVLVAKGLTEDRVLSQFNLAGVYEYHPSREEEGEQANAHTRDPGWLKAVMTLEARGRVLIEWSGSEPEMPSKTRSGLVRGQWAVGVDSIQLFNMDRGPHGRGCGYALGERWFVEISEDSIQLHPVNLRRRGTRGADGQMVYRLLQPGRYVLRTGD